MTKSGRFPPTRRVGILAFDGVQILDIAGPAQALTTANEEDGPARYAVELLSRRGGPVTTASGPAILTRRLAAQQRFDTLIVPGGPGVHRARRSPALVAALAALAARARRVCAVCTGAFLLAETGLLDGRRAVTHWRACDRLAREYPRLRVEPDPIFIRDGHIWTTAGVTAGIDLTLALIEEDCGRAAALAVARRLVVYLRRPGGQRQFSEPLSLQGGGGGAYAALLQTVAERPGQRWRVDDLAAEAKQGARTFYRRFRAATGATPAQAVERIRCERARLYLETTDLPLAGVARRVGFSSEAVLRRALRRLYGRPPSELRRTAAAAR